MENPAELSLGQIAALDRSITPPRMRVYAGYEDSLRLVTMLDCDLHSYIEEPHRLAIRGFQGT